MKLSYLIFIRLWKQLFRDPRSLALALIAPLIYIVLFGMAFGGEIEHLPIIIINEDSDAEIVIKIGQITVYNENVSSIGANIVENLEKSSKVDVSTSMSSFDSIKSSIDNKKYVCAIWIPENFTYNLASPLGENITIELYLDNSNPQIGVVVIQAIQEAFQDAAGEFKDNFGMSLSYAYGEDLSTLDFFAPAMIIFGVFFFSFILILMNLIGERKSGTLPLLLQCPYDKLQIILGYLMAFSILSMVQTTEVIIMASIFFNVSFGSTLGQYISLYIGAVAIGWTALVLAIFLSSFARSEFQAIQFVPTILLPVLLLSGIIIPLNQIPEIIRWVSYLIPTTYGVHLLRKITVEGYVLELFDTDLIVQFLFFIFFLIGSRLSLKET